MNLKKLESYLRVNLLGPGPRLMKKNLPGCGLTMVEKHCPRLTRGNHTNPPMSTITEVSVTLVIYFKFKWLYQALLINCKCECEFIAQYMEVLWTVNSAQVMCCTAANKRGDVSNLCKLFVNYPWKEIGRNGLTQEKYCSIILYKHVWKLIHNYNGSFGTLGEQPILEEIWNHQLQVCFSVMTNFDFNIVCTLNHDVTFCSSMWSRKEGGLSWENVLMAWEMVGDWYSSKIWIIAGRR